LTKVVLVNPEVTQDRRSWFDSSTGSELTTNGLILVPFALSSSKGVPIYVNWALGDIGAIIGWRLLWKRM